MLDSGSLQFFFSFMSIDLLVHSINSFHACLVSISLKQAWNPISADTDVRFSIRTFFFALFRCETVAHWNMSNVKKFWRKQKKSFSLLFSLSPTSGIAVNIWFYIFYMFAMFNAIVAGELWKKLKKSCSLIICAMRCETFFFLSPRCSFNYRHSNSIMEVAACACRVLILKLDIVKTRNLIIWCELARSSVGIIFVFVGFWKSQFSSKAGMKFKPTFIWIRDCTHIFHPFVVPSSISAHRLFFSYIIYFVPQLSLHFIFWSYFPIFIRLPK